MKKIFYLILAVIIIASGCTKDISSINIDPKNPSTAPSYSFFTNAQRFLSNALTSTNVNRNTYRLFVQHWQETQYPEESQYDIATREVNDFQWNTLYRDVIRDLQEAKNLIPNDVADPAIQKNQLAIAEIMQVFSFYYLVTTFGNIPYTEALDIEKAFPAYDDAKTVYDDLLKRLDVAIGNLDASAASFGNADIIYGGDVAQWKKFANSFKLKMGITISDFDPVAAKTVIESAAAAGLFTSNADNALIAYQTTQPNANPVWEDLVESGRDDFVAAKTIIDSLLSLQDPRIDNFFTPDQSGINYSGADPGVQSAYAQYSHVEPSITAPDFPGLLLDYSEVELSLAEALQRGFIVGGTAETHYANGVTASIEYWGGTPEEATAYLQQPGVAFDPVNFQKSVGVQKWLALYNRGWDAWTEWRRLDYPQLEEAHDALSGMPVRMPYPVNEQNVNRKNFETAATAIGGDAVETKLWFDKF